MEYQYTFTYLARLFIRDARESDKAWQKRKRSARTGYRKNERRRHREAQSRGIYYVPYGIEFINKHVHLGR